MTFARIRAVAGKELLHIRRDPRSLGMALALPVVMLVLFGYALTLDVDRIPTLAVDLSGSPAARDFLSLLQGSRFFRLQETVRDQTTVERAFDRGEALLAVVIPPDFERRLLRGLPASVQVLVEGSDANTASIALGYIQAVVARFNRELASPGSSLRGEVRVWYNPSLESKNYVVPGLLAVILMIIAALLSSLSIAREWEGGTMESLLATPLQASELVLGKMAAYFAVALADTLIAVLVGVWVFQVPFRGDLPSLALACFLFILGALGWGIFISALARSQLLAYQMGMITSFLPAFLLSGFIYAIENMPEPIQWLTRLIPARYFISILRGIFLKGLDLTRLLPEVLWLAAFALGVLYLATGRIRRRIYP